MTLNGRRPLPVVRNPRRAAPPRTARRGVFDRQDQMFRCVRSFEYTDQSTGRVVFCHAGMTWASPDSAAYRMRPDCFE